MINELMSTIKTYISDPNQTNEHEMSTYIEDYIVYNYAKLADENLSVAQYMEDYLLDVCEQTEPGIVGTNFNSDLKREYELIKKMLA